MHTDYLNPVIRQLRDQQVRFAPREKKVEQVDRAETAARRDRSPSGPIPTNISATGSPISGRSRSRT